MTTSSNLARAIPPTAPHPAQAPSRAPRPEPTPHTKGPARQSGRHSFALAILLAPLIVINILGAPYYLAPIEVRVRHPMHQWLRPSGAIGQSAGIAAMAIFIFLWLYPLRKKWKALAFTGAVGRWLDVHVTTALTLPLLLAIHSAWRSTGLIGLGFVAMLIVIASGVIGRYLYTRIPRARSGVEFTRDEVIAEREELIRRIAATTGLDAATVDQALRIAPPGDAHERPLRVLLRLVTNDLFRWRRSRELRARWKRLAPANKPLSRRALSEVVALASREMSLTQQSQMLSATHRVFRYWHVAHRPFAITALIAVVVHVAVVIAVGATWFR